MITGNETKVIVGDEMEWELMPNHRELYHREILNAQQADGLGIRTSSILWEKNRSGRTGAPALS